LKERATGTLHNLGLILQMNGIALLVPVIVSLYLNESSALTALVLSAFSSLFVGFFLTNFSEEGEMHFESICSLMILTFVSLGAIGSIPYIYLGEEIFGKIGLMNILTDGFFESVSGFSTTGLTTITDVEALPKSIILFRGLSQWIGGIGIVYMMILFLGSPGETTTAVSELSGFEKLKPSFRGTFWKILLTPATMGILAVMMIFGATSFSVHDNLWKRELRKVITYEYRYYLLYIILLTGFFLIVFLRPNQSVSELIFHVISAATTTGFQFMNLGNSELMKSVIIMIMFIGGTSFSTASGFKMIRFIIISKSVPWAVRKASLPSKAITPLKMGHRALFEKDVLIAFLFMGLGILSIFAFSLVFVYYGYDFQDSLFELTSAFGNIGFTSGITEIGLPNPLKLILTLQMIFGRVEIIPFLVFIRVLVRR
jgi:trk system potassium uptake protein TrkH